MPRRLTLAAALAIAWLLAAAAPAGAQSAASDALRRDIDFARSKVYPALVNIGVVSQAYSGGRARRFPAAGSGVIVSAAGHILTNFHVAGHATRITCTLTDGERIDADIVADDPLTDLSVLKLRLGERADAGKPLPFATLGDSDALQVGDYVLAMGNPLTLSSSLTLGVVSNRQRVFTDFTGTEMAELDLGAGEMTGLFTRWIQHDALILPGNSGGPLVNLRGEIVGINELGGAGVGFAIPSNLAARVLNQVLTFNHVRRAWLGVSVLPVEKIGRQKGALVSSVADDSPAMEAGLQPGDVLLSVNDEPVVVRYFEQVPDFYLRVSEIVPGREVRVEYERGGERRTATMTADPMDKFLGEERAVRELGLTLREITGPMARSRRLPTRDGVIVTGIRPGHPFEDARPRVLPGDIIVALAGTPTPDIDAFLAALEKAEPEEGEEEGRVAVEFLRERQSLLSMVRIEPSPESPRGGELPDPWLGVQTQVLTPGVARAIGMEGQRGFRVTEVYPWTKAAEAGLEAGDVIVAIDGEELDAYREQDAQDLRLAIESFAVREEVELTVRRGDRTLTMDVELEPKPEPSYTADKATQEDFEFTVREITFMDRVEQRLEEDQAGVLVVDVVNGGWAHMAGLRVGDILLEVNGQAVESVDRFEQIMDGVLEQRPETVKLFLQRGHRTHFIFIEPVWPKDDQAGDGSGG